VDAIKCRFGFKMNNSAKFSLPKNIICRKLGCSPKSHLKIITNLGISNEYVMVRLYGNLEFFWRLIRPAAKKGETIYSRVEMSNIFWGQTPNAKQTRERNLGKGKMLLLFIRDQKIY
jgi:hypothetical protein